MAARIDRQFSRTFSGLNLFFKTKRRLFIGTKSYALVGELFYRAFALSFFVFFFLEFQDFPQFYIFTFSKFYKILWFYTFPIGKIFFPKISGLPNFSKVLSLKKKYKYKHNLKKNWILISGTTDKWSGVSTNKIHLISNNIQNSKATLNIDGQWSWAMPSIFQIQQKIIKKMKST